MFSRSRFLKVFAVAAVAALALAACGGSKGDQETLALGLTGIRQLANGYHYEGWAIIDGSPVSTGKFNVNDDGGLVDLSGRVIANGEFVAGTDLSDAAVIAITIEPAGDTDSVPSGAKYLAGSVSDGSADVTVGHSAALGDSLTGAAGTYILATPTDDDDTNETSGIWYIDLSSGLAGPGLQLPALPPAWEYEGWVIFDGTPVSTGRFTDVAAADSGNPFSGPLPGKPFPGEDFLRNAPAELTFPADIRAMGAAISIEPVDDDSPGDDVRVPGHRGPRTARVVELGRRRGRDGVARLHRR